MKEYHYINHKKYISYGILIIIFGFFGAYSPAQMASGHKWTDERNAESELRPVLECFSADRASLYRCYQTPMSEKVMTRMKQFYQNWQKELTEYNFQELSLDGQIDFLLFRNLLEFELRSIALDEKRNHEAVFLIPFWKTIVTLDENRHNSPKLNAEKTAEILNKMEKQIRQFQSSLENSSTEKKNKHIQPLSKTLAYRAANLTNRLRRVLKDWFEFYYDYDPLFTWWNEKPYEAAEDALKSYSEYLRKEIVGIQGEERNGPIIGDPIGREALLVELASAMIPYTPEELIEAGKKEYAWCESEMIQASRKLGFDKEWLKALEYVKTLHMDPGEQPQFIQEQALEAIVFLKKNDLVTIPPLAEETWRIEMMSPERQKINPFFTGGEIISVSFPTITMSHEQKMMSIRGNNIHFARATIHHELIPGHHLQGFMTDRYKTYRRIFATPFWLEGWPLHWEMLFWDLGFPQTPENCIGMLFWRMHRCARIVFSLSFHLGKMTTQECIDYLVNRVGHERENATAEIRRSFAGGYEPLYQAAYMVGGLQMRALYHELVGTDQKTNREFHDAVLKENSMPIEMLRAKLENQELTEDFVPHWKFLAAPDK
jgi:uncharacterized protein (DUF885 family)